MIDSVTGKSMRVVKASAGPNDLKEAAHQIGVALEKPVQCKITEVNADILKLDAGSRAGLKAGDRLVVLHQGSAIGTVLITASEEASSVGHYEGKTPPIIGDPAIAQQR